MLELAEDMLCITLLGVDMATMDHLLDLLDQDRPILVTRDAKGTLNYVVCELIVNHLGEAELGISDLHPNYPVQDHTFTAVWSILNTLLNDI